MWFGGRAQQGTRKRFSTRILASNRSAPRSTFYFTLLQVENEKKVVSRKRIFYFVKKEKKTEQTKKKKRGTK